MIDGHLDVRNLQDLLDGTLDETASINAWQHIAECRECRSLHGSFILADRTLRTDAAVPSTANGVMRRIAAALLVGAGLAAAPYMGRSTNEPVERAESTLVPVHVDAGFELTAVVETRTPNGRELVTTRQSMGVRTISREHIRGMTIDADQHLVISETFKGVER